MNKIILMGRLVRDPDIRYTQGENSFAIARYTIAVDRRFRNAKGETETDFIDCVTFRRAAEFAEKYMHQGMRMLVSGTLQNNNYTKNDGTKVYTYQVVVDEQEFADSKGASSGSNQYGNNYSGNTSASGFASADKESKGDGFMNIPDGVEYETLPFNRK